MPCFVYILRLENNHLDVGSTNDLDRHLAEHRSGSGSKATAESPPLGILHSEPYPDRPSALQRERQLKRWSHDKKLALINGDKVELKRLAQYRNRSKGLP